MNARAVQGALLHTYSLIILLAVWQIASSVGWVAPQVLPAPSAIAARFWTIAQQGTLAEHLAPTLIRLVSGLGIATVIGVALGVGAAQSRAGSQFLEPLVRVLAPIPKIALYPAFILLLGFDHASKIALVVADAVFPILLAAYHGARMVDDRLLWSARAAGTSPGRCVIKVILPAALPSILTGLRIAVVISCVVVFLSEMISSTDGLGHLMIRAARSFRTIDMFVPIVTISILGLILDTGMSVLRRRLLVGFPEER